MASQSLELSESDLRSLVRVGVGKWPPEERRSVVREVLLERLCQLVAARRWLWLAGHCPQPGQVEWTAFHSGGSSSVRRPGVPRNLCFEAFFGPGVAALDGQCATYLQAPWQSTGERALSPLLREANQSPFILSCRFALGGWSAIGLYRGTDQDPFTERERTIVDVVLGELPAFNEPAGTLSRKQVYLNLSPQKRTVYRLLVEGRHRKRIAAELGITLNTLGGYVKEIYRKFGVRSQAELMRGARREST